MHDEPPISGSSGQQALPDMATPTEMFWMQFWDYLGKYGAMFVTATIVGGITLGYALHILHNVLPARKSLKEQATKKKQEEERDKDISEEEAEIRMGDCVIRGAMNSKVISSLRKSAIYEEKSDRGLHGAMKDIEQERRHLLGEDKEDSGEDTMEEEEEEEDEPLPLEDINAEAEQSTNPANKKEEDPDMLQKLGTLHGKLATAQLRARTRRMQMEMSQEERQSEAEMRAKQLESIMSLMMQNKEKFGMDSDDVKEQLNLYNF